MQVKDKKNYNQNDVLWNTYFYFLLFHSTQLQSQECAEFEYLVFSVNLCFIDDFHLLFPFVPGQNEPLAITKCGQFLVIVSLECKLPTAHIS